MIRAIGLFGALICLGLGAAAADDSQQPVIAIGVRVDAPPFAWDETPKEQPAVFRGYLRDICVEATKRAGFHSREYPVTARQRVAILNGDPTITVNNEPVTLDLLCDPTTINVKRLRAIAKGETDPERLMFSPIVFVANGSYTSRKGLPGGGKSFVAERDMIGWSAQGSGPGGDAAANCYCWKDGKCDPLKGYLAAGFVIGATSEDYIRYAVSRDALGQSNSSYVCPKSKESYQEMIEGLCDGDLQYVFGDMDITSYYAREIGRGQAAVGDTACAIVAPDRPLSYEPYALLISDNNIKTGFRPKFIGALYQMFSDQTISGSFGTYFPGLEKSSALSILFRINSVPGLCGPEEVSSQCYPERGGGGDGGEAEDGEAQAAQQ